MLSSVYNKTDTLDSMRLSSACQTNSQYQSHRLQSYRLCSL